MATQTATHRGPTRVEATRVEPDYDAHLVMLDRLADLMDSKFVLPGTGIRFGLDSLIGLLPIGGDVAGGLIQAALIGLAIKHFKVPRHVAGRMVVNALIDTTVGSIPVLGDLFDVGFKANRRNVDLLREAVAKGRRR